MEGHEGTRRPTETGKGVEHDIDNEARARAARRDEAVRGAVQQGLLGPDAALAGLLDVTGIRESAAALRTAFDAVVAPGTPVLHAFAVKATPLVPVLRLLHEEGIGAEVASPGELALARAAGVPPERTVLDSPAKTPAELREALALGIAVNADNPQELDRLDALVRPSMCIRDRCPRPAVAHPVAARPPDQPADRRRQHRGDLDGDGHLQVRRGAARRGGPGVGGAGLCGPAVADPAARTHRLAGDPAAAAGAGRRPYVRTRRGDQRPDLSLIHIRYGLVTEFGRSLLARHGTVVARVEYAKISGGRRIAVTHAGVQVATRTVYAPGAWPLRIAAYDAKGRPKAGPEVVQDVAGPACFSGDLLAEERALPLLEQGDYAAALDTGAYYFAHHYAYNSLARPGIYGFAPDGAGSVVFATVREPQTVAEIVAESGGAHADNLTTLPAPGSR